MDNQHNEINKANQTINNQKIKAAVITEISEYSNSTNKQQGNESSSSCKSIAITLLESKMLDKIKAKKSECETDGKVSLSGIATNYSKLDEIIDGLQPEHLITIAARTGVGKTWLALNIIKNIAIDQKVPVGLFSLEMSNNQVHYRLISLCSGIPSKSIKNGTINDDELKIIQDSVINLENSSLFMTDKSANSNLSILSDNIKKACAEYKLKLVVIDHIGLVKNTTTKDRHNEVGEIIRTLKLAAKDLKIPIIIIAQLNRNADKPEKPQLSHLRESGAIEQDSDIVIFIHRNDYFDSSAKPGEAEIIIAKNRDGEQGISLHFKYDQITWLLSESDAKSCNIRLHNKEQNTQKARSKKPYLQTK